MFPFNTSRPFVNRYLLKRGELGSIPSGSNLKTMESRTNGKSPKRDLLINVGL